MNLKVLMYHYIFNENEKLFSALQHLKTQEFENQIKFLSAKFNIIKKDEAVNFFANNFRSQHQPLILTFDDGLKCHYTEAFSLLKKNNLEGYFFIPTLPIVEKRIPTIHKTHILRGYLNDDEFINSFTDLLVSEIGPFNVDELAPDDKVKVTYRWDKLEVKKIKYIMNMVISEELREKIINKLFIERYPSSEKEIVSKLFLSKEELIEMKKNGMIIGGHSHAHFALGKIPLNDAIKDIELNLNSLSEIINRDVTVFSYPYGKPDTYNAEIISLLKSKGIELAFSSVVGDNKNNQDNFQIKRIDPKDINYE